MKYIYIAKTTKLIVFELLKKTTQNFKDQINVLAFMDLKKVFDIVDQEISPEKLLL